MVFLFQFFYERIKYLDNIKNKNQSFGKQYRQLVRIIFPGSGLQAGRITFRTQFAYCTTNIEDTINLTPLFYTLKCIWHVIIIQY